MSKTRGGAAYTILFPLPATRSRKRSGISSPPPSPPPNVLLLLRVLLISTSKNLPQPDPARLG